MVRGTFQLQEQQPCNSLQRQIYKFYNAQNIYVMLNPPDLTWLNVTSGQIYLASPTLQKLKDRVSH
jgi:hypothetical protein